MKNLEGMQRENEIEMQRCLLSVADGWKYASAGETYLRRTLISFSSESSLPLSAVLSMILTANSFPASVFDSASRTWEKAPLKMYVKQKK